MKAVVCPTDELARGEMCATKLGPIPVVVIRAPDDSLHALLDKCLHQGGPLSKGRIGGATYSEPGPSGVGDFRLEKEGEVLRCPWHGFEYDIKTGCTLTEPDRCLSKFTVREEDGNIVVER